MNKKVEELVAKRMEDEMKKREEYIEAEVQKRLVEAKRKMEKELYDDFERQKQIEYKKQFEKEVCTLILYKHKKNRLETDYFAY